MSVEAVSPFGAPAPEPEPGGPLNVSVQDFLTRLLELDGSRTRSENRCSQSYYAARTWHVDHEDRVGNLVASVVNRSASPLAFPPDGTTIRISISANAER